MRVIHVTDADLPARRFNGFDLLDDLASRGVEGTQVVLNKTSDDPRVLGLLQGRGDAELQDSIKEVERRHSINNLLTPWGALLASTSQFREADVVHYHLIHNQVISLYDMERLFGLKPTVWSFHDPWPLTGHCVHPMGCEGWLRGCDPCPFLDRLFPLAHDHADQLWRAKKRVFSGLDVDVVVASEWLLEMVKRSALTSHFEQVHLIPFGIDTRLFVANDRKQSSRRRLGVPDDDFVIFFRATSWDVKGLSSILEALAARPPTRPTTVLTVDERGLLKGLRREYRVVELGWIDDEAMYPLTFSACDVFLMPSLAETFGLMAVEAMAAGRPVVCFEGTALPAVTHAPECGIAVSAGNANALRDALDRLASDSSESERRGQLGRSIVTDVYGHERYLDSMAALYRSVLARHQTGDMAESVR